MEATDTAILEPAANGNPGSMSTDDAIIAAIEQQRVVLEARAEKLRAELAKIVPELKRYEKAISVIRGEPLAHPRVSKAPKSTAKQKVSDEEITRTWEAIQRLLEDSDEFTQVQVRAITNQKSSTSSLAFEALRQEGRIRFARQQANFKYYRLTRSAVADEQP
jgi:hypothetical protein